MNCLPNSFSRLRASYNLCNFSTRIFSVSATRMGRPKVFVTRCDIPQVAVKMLKEKCDVIIYEQPKVVPRDYFLEHVAGVDGIYCLTCDKIDKELLDAAGPSLKVVGTSSVGYDHIDIQAAKAAGVKVGHTPGVLTNATADLTVALVLAASRRLFESHQELLSGGWANSAYSPLWMCGQELAGSTVGIYGLGRIGQAVLRRLVPFEPARFLYSGRTRKEHITQAEFVAFDMLLKESDFVIVTCALNDETRGLFNARAFSLMKPNAVFVNTSRGGTVNQEDLVEALKANKIFAAGLDVMTPEPLPTDHELTKLKNCVLVPHIGSATIQTETAMAKLTVRNILAGIQGQPLPAEVA